MGFHLEGVEKKLPNKNEARAQSSARAPKRNHSQHAIPHEPPQSVPALQQQSADGVQLADEALAVDRVATATLASPMTAKPNIKSLRM